MTGTDRRQIESALRAHYRSERDLAKPSASAIERTAALVAVAAAGRRAERHVSVLEFATAVVRFSPKAFWLVPAAVVVLACALAATGTPSHGAEAVLVASGPALAAACLACVVRARSLGMQELEASCMHNAFAVACARLAVCGCAALAALTIACAACSAVVPVGAAAAYALAPCLVSAAGGFALARRVASADSAMAAVVWSAGVGSLCILLRFAVPALYADAAVWAWAAAAAAGALWCAREVVCWLRFSLQGGCAPDREARIGSF